MQSHHRDCGGVHTQHLKIQFRRKTNNSSCPRTRKHQKHTCCLSRAKAAAFSHAFNNYYQRGTAVTIVMYLENKWRSNLNESSGTAQIQAHAHTHINVRAVCRGLTRHRWISKRQRRTIIAMNVYLDGTWALHSRLTTITPSSSSIYTQQYNARAVRP